MSLPPEDSQVRVVLLDIEGTTTPVDFVYKTLFPYASRKVESFFREDYRNPKTQSLVEELRAQHERDASVGVGPPAWIAETDEARLVSSIEYVHWLMARDSKCTALKTLQGRIWQQGYERGELHGEVYADVPPAFARWRRQGRVISIYSSGSVLAQQLLFRSTAAGDLTEYISGFFDTRIGTKTESGSYTKIAESLGHHASEVLFVSDAIKEVEAARVASMQAVLCVRDSRPAEHASGQKIVNTFDRILSD
ncbi:MAG: phosphoglycolate phosphatase [Candidatus Acidoferrum typicum]|nr:phosphoglycolate phosphatase [Candidatus Acidoferrum typicum]